MNRITDNPAYKSALIDWAADHYLHFGCYPGSFAYLEDDLNEIDFTEREIWEAIETLINKGELN